MSQPGGSWTSMRLGSVSLTRPEEVEGRGANSVASPRFSRRPEEFEGRGANSVASSRLTRRSSVRVPNVGGLNSGHPLLDQGTDFIESIRSLTAAEDTESEVVSDDEYWFEGVRSNNDPVTKRWSTNKNWSNTNTFKKIAGAIIMANTVVIALEAIYIQQQFSVFDSLELAFTAFYTVEISWRMWERGILTFLSTDDWWWNWFDLVITVLSVVDTALSETTGSSSGASVTRLFRVFRILRMFRAMKFLNEVDYVLAQAATATLKLAAIVTLVLFVSSIIATNMLWDSRDPIVADMFSNLPNSMWAMFKLMTLDDWQSVCERVIKVKPGMLMFFVVFIFTTSIALISLVPAIFIEISLNARKREEEVREAKQSLHLRKEKKRLLHTLFQLTDRDHNGKVSVEEIKAILTNDTCLRKLQESGLTGPGELRDLRLGLFDLWEESFEESARSDFEISEEEFITGLLRVRENVSQAVLWRCITATRLMLRDLSAHVRKELRRTDSKYGNLEKEVRGLIKAATADILTSQENIRHTLIVDKPQLEHGSGSFIQPAPNATATAAALSRASAMGGTAGVASEEVTFGTYGSAGFLRSSNTNEDLEDSLLAVQSLMRHLQRHESAFLDCVDDGISSPQPPSPKVQPPSRKTMQEEVDDSTRSVKSTRSAKVSIDENAMFLGDPIAHKDTLGRQTITDMVTTVIEDDEPVAKDIPSAAMFETEGLSAEAAYLL